MMSPYELLAIFILSAPGLLAALAFQYLSPELIHGGRPARKKYRWTVTGAWLVLTGTAAVAYVFFPAVAGLLILSFAGIFLFQDARFLFSPARRRARANLRASKRMEGTLS